MTCLGNRFLVTRGDGVRAIACEACMSVLPTTAIIENTNVPHRIPCATEAYPGAWCCTFAYPPEFSE